MHPEEAREHGLEGMLPRLVGLDQAADARAFGAAQIDLALDVGNALMFRHGIGMHGRFGCGFRLEMTVTVLTSQQGREIRVNPFLSAAGVM